MQRWRRTLIRDLDKYRKMQARAEARLEQSRSDAEYAANLEQLRHASAMIEQTLYKMNGW